MLDTPLVELERRLDPARFFRVHRGTLVNLGWVHELHTDVAGQLVIRLRGDKRPEVQVSRDRVRPLKERLGLA
jgi:two-component system LytT family response regulator